MNEGVNNNQNKYRDFDTLHRDLLQQEATDAKPFISASENTEESLESSISFEELKSSYEGLKDGPHINNELVMLISTLISSMVSEGNPQPPLQNDSTDIRSEAVGAVESAGPANSQGASRRLQQILSSDSRFVQQLMDYLNLSSPARKDGHIQNMGLEYKGLPPTLSGYHSKRQELFELVQAHMDGVLDKEALRQRVQPLLSYIDPAIMVIDNTLKMEEARINAPRQRL